MKRFQLAAASCAALYCGLLVASPADNSPPAGPLEHVLVSVPIHRTEAETALPVSVLSDKALHDAAAASIGETLAFSPGIANASFGPGVGQPVIRGQQGARVRVLQNSTGSGDASTSSGDHAVSVEPILAESIEVLRGPATLLYGGGAIGGVVNVIDNRIPVAVPDSTRGKMEVRHASASDETTAVLSLEGGVDALALHLDATTRDSNDVDIPGRAALHHDDESTDGYIDNTDTDYRTATVGASYLFDSGYIGIAVNQLDNEYGIPPGAHEHDPLAAEEESVRIDVEQTRVDLRGDLHVEQQMLETLRWFLTYSDYQHRELEGADVGTVWSNESWEGRFELLHRPLAGWHGVMGVQLTDFELSAVGDESFIPRTEVSRFGVFLVEDYHWGDWLFELGGRWDNEQLDPVDGTPDQRFDSVSLSASALWQFMPEWSLGLALSHSGRAPVIEELYSNAGNAAGSYIEHVASGAIEVGDAALDNEQANNMDFTLSYRTGDTDAYLTVFYNDFRDFIYLANTGQQQAGTDVLVYSQDDAVFTGAEYEVSQVLGMWLGGELSVDLFGDWIQGQLQGGQDLPRLPPMRVGGRLNYQWAGFSGFVAVVDAAKQDKPGEYEAPTAGYTRWDAGIDYSFGFGEQADALVFVRLNNLTDEEIRHSTSLLREVAPEAGRSIETGLRLSF